jgi:DNA-binding CsgD family transcriptional regulator
VVDDSQRGKQLPDTASGRAYDTNRNSADGVRVRLPPELDAELEGLLRRLMDQFASTSPGSRGLPVIVDVEVEGTRCVVIFAPHASPHGALSPREHEIAQMVGHGLPNKTIAANLGISSWTVSTHLRRMFIKFGVNSRAALVAKILEEDFLL